MFNKNATPFTPASEFYVHTKEELEFFEKELAEKPKKPKKPVDTEDNKGHRDTVYYTIEDHNAWKASKTSKTSV